MKRSNWLLLVVFILVVLSNICVLHFTETANNTLSYICLVVQGILCILLGAIIGHSK